MHARSAAHLSHTADALLHVLGGDEHEVGQLVHDYDDLRHGLRALLLLMGVVAREVAHAHLGKEAVALEHLDHGPLQSAGGLFRVCDDGNIEVRDAVIDAELDHLGVYHDKPYLLRRGLIQQAQQQRVEADGFAGAGGACDEHVRQLCDVADDALAAYVLADGERQARGRVFEGRRVDDVAQVYDADYLVRHLDADGGYLVRDGRYTDVHDAQREREVAGEVGELSELHARVELKVVARDGGPARDADYVRRDAEAVQRGLQPVAVEGNLVTAVDSGSRALAQEVYGRELIFRRRGSGVFYLSGDSRCLGRDLSAAGLGRLRGLYRLRGGHVHGREGWLVERLLKIKYRLRSGRGLLLRLGAAGPRLLLGEVADLHAAVVHILVGLVVHGYIDDAVLGLFGGLCRLLGLLAGRADALRLRLRLVLVLRALAAREPACDLADAEIHGVHEEEQEKRQQQWEGPVDTEHGLQRHGEQPRDESAALHELSFCIQSLDQLAEAAAQLQGSARKQQMRHSAHDDRQHDAAKQPECHGPAAVECEGYGRKQQRGREQIKAPAQQALYEAAEEVNEPAGNVKIADKGENGQKGANGRADFPADGLRRVFGAPCAVFRGGLALFGRSAAFLGSTRRAGALAAACGIRHGVSPFRR